jgi:hypothetical protein
LRRAEKRADTLEDEAAFAIDYANTSIEQAQLAVIDAIVGRLASDEARKHQRRPVAERSGNARRAIGRATLPARKLT